MSATAASDASAGRAKHLGELAQVFKHRHGTWRDFGQFLKREFRDPSGQGTMVGTASGLSEMTCRHNAGGRHHTALAGALGPPVHSPGFNHERFARPCVSFGSYDAGKNGGLVVHDLCVRAAAFLAATGRGDPNESTRRDFDYDPHSALLSSSPRVGSSQVSDASGDVEMSEDITLTQAAFESASGMGEVGGNDDGFFDDEDVREAPGQDDTDSGDDSSCSVDVSDIPSSQDSAAQLIARGSSTKMRAATLGYLWNFADDPRQLRTEFKRLRSDATVCVLHLCGCGLCFTEPSGVKVVGCAERSHLKLGSSEENGRHRTFHHMLELSPVPAYAGLVAIIHQARDGGGVF